MKLQSFAEIAESIGQFTEYFRYDGNVEHLKTFLEGTQYHVIGNFRSTAKILSTNNNEEAIFTGTYLLKNIHENGTTIFIWDGCYISGYNREINRAKLSIDDPLYGFDIRGWANGLCMIQLKDETFQRILVKDLLEESKWKDNYLCVILNKEAWLKFKEKHNFEIDDENWKPSRPIVEY